MRIVLIPLLIFCAFVSNAQTSTYLADLAAVKATVEKMHSFKAQIKGDKRSRYNALYQRLAMDTTSNPNSYQYFYNLAQLLLPLRDNHVAFSQFPMVANFQPEASLDHFVTTKEFLDYPTSNINIDSLKAQLATKPTASVEGIYRYDTLYKVGLFKRGGNEYIGVILNSNVKQWVKGQIAIHLFQHGPNLYKAIYGHPLYKEFRLETVEKYQNGSLINAKFYGSHPQSVYSKQLPKADHVNLPNSATLFSLRNLEDDVQYLLIRTFQINRATAQKSQQFYDSIKPLLKAPYLVLDLRNNYGGADKERKKYFKLLKDYVRKGHLYVLLNNATVSQAERFTLKLKELKNVTTLGQTTQGTLTYGRNYDRRMILPSGRFQLNPTDMRGSRKYLQYEDYGINPDIVLREDTNWIEQVIYIIQKK